MALTINTNISSMNVQNAMSRSKLDSVLARLSSGNRITSASVDPAGLAISEGMRADMRSMTQDIKNAMDGYSMAQVAEGGMSSIMANLSGMRELATQAANGILSAEDRASLNQQFAAMKDAIDQTVGSSEFNGQNLLDGSLSVTLQVGIHNTSEDQLSLNVAASDSASLGIAGDISTQAGAQNMLDTLDNAINQLSSSRSNVGAFQNRVESTVSNLNTTYVNTAQADSRIRDADMAFESAQLVRETLLQQTQTSMLAQANSLSQSALSLLR